MPGSSPPSSEPHSPAPSAPAPSASLTESPNSKLKFKNFYRQFKHKEKEGFDAALQFAKESLTCLPEKIHYRVYLEIADLAKRENRIREAQQYYTMVNEQQPTIVQGWLEHAKMEEECGHLDRCRVRHTADRGSLSLSRV